MLSAASRLIGAHNRRQQHELRVGVREIMRNEEGLLPVQLNDRVKAFIRFKIEEASELDDIARALYMGSRAHSGYMGGEVPTSTDVAAALILSRKQVQRVAVTRYRKWSKQKNVGQITDVPMDVLIEEVSGIMESASNDRVSQTMRVIAFEDEKRNGETVVNTKTGKEEGQVRVVRLPRADGCRFCQEMAYMTDGITSFHKNCDCRPAAVFPDQALSSPGLDKGREIATGIDRDGNPVEGWDESKRTQAADYLATADPVAALRDPEEL